MNIKRIAVALPLLVVLGGCETKVRAQVSSRPPEGGVLVPFTAKTRIEIWTDPETGCQYFARNQTPRLSMLGNPMCGHR